MPAYTRQNTGSAIKTKNSSSSKNLTDLIRYCIYVSNYALVVVNAFAY